MVRGVGAQAKSWVRVVCGWDAPLCLAVAVYGSTCKVWGMGCVLVGAPEGSEEVVTRKVWEESWWARRRACSPRGTARMCSFWISSMLPMVRPDSLAMARLSGKLELLKLVIRFTCKPHHFNHFLWQRQSLPPAPPPPADPYRNVYCFVIQELSPPIRPAGQCENCIAAVCWLLTVLYSRPLPWGPPTFGWPPTQDVYTRQHVAVKWQRTCQAVDSGWYPNCVHQSDSIGYKGCVSKTMDSYQM